MPLSSRFMVFSIFFIISSVWLLIYCGRLRLRLNLAIVWSIASRFCNAISMSSSAGVILGGIFHLSVTERAGLMFDLDVGEALRKLSHLECHGHPETTKGLILPRYGCGFCPVTTY